MAAQVLKNHGVHLPHRLAARYPSAFHAIEQRSTPKLMKP
jgi:hypothetical protein